VYCLEQLRYGSLCSGSHDGCIKVWSIITGEMEMSINGHTSRVTGIVVIDELRICSCSSWDKTIRVWNTRSGECEKNIGEQDPINHFVLLEEGKLWILSKDGTVAMWNVDSGVRELKIRVSSSEDLCKLVQ
jgi:WD40 repeat protein